MVYPSDKTLVDLFEEQVLQTPDAVALVFEDRVLTYRELDEVSNRLGHYLQSVHGIRGEALVSILLERSEWQIISILGIQKAGGGYVPIDPSYPHERVSYMLSDSQSRLLIDAAELSRFAAVSDQYSVSSPLRDVDADNIAYVIYTSGTTGQPKGVMVCHRNIVNYITYQRREFGITADENILQLSRISFDASVEQIFIALLSGARLTLINKDLLLAADQIESLIDEAGITHIHGVPSLLKTLRPRVYRALKRVVSGGEPCDRSLADSWSGYHSFYNKYGPTETTVSSVELHYRPGMREGAVVPIGVPVGNTCIYILDAQEQLLPVGVPGEIYIGGAGVARGYLNKEELTAARFVRHPFEAGSRLYRTGDWGKWQADGNIVYVGRKDEQVKLRGYRIELGEIENVLQQGDGIRQSVVVVKGEAGNRYLVGYVVCEGTFNKEAVQAYLSEQLPDYMVPSVLVCLEELPLTPNGKIDRRALSQLDTGVLLTGGYTAAETEAEHQLVKLWEELLKVDRVGVTDNFFELGGHSLLAMKMLAEINNIFGIQLSIKTLFQFPFIAGLSEYIEIISTTTNIENPTSSEVFEL
jgi:amino acid adenylation domain-containing protein